MLHFSGDVSDIVLLAGTLFLYCALLNRIDVLFISLFSLSFCFIDPLYFFLASSTALELFATLLTMFYILFGTQMFM
jgi:hypothetical protein